MTKKKNITGHSVKIDWAKVDYMLQAGCSGRQTAANLGISKDALYKGIIKVKKKSFLEYRTEMRAAGQSNILCKQFGKAMKGDNSMLIWVGKQQLGQRDEVKTTHAFDGKLGTILDHLKNVKSEDDFESGEGKDDAIEPQDD